VRPSITNNFGLWRFNAGASMPARGDATVLAGASRLYFDMQLHVWERNGGEASASAFLRRHLPLAAVEYLAADPQFTGRLLIAVEPDLFFSAMSIAAGRSLCTQGIAFAAHRAVAVDAPDRAISRLR